MNSVAVIRAPLIPRGKSNRIGLMLNYVSYPITASLYALEWAFQRRFDTIIVQQLSPVMVSIPAILYKKIHDVPLHVWVLDLWPESLMSAGGIKNRHVLHFFRRIAKSEYKNADKIWMSSNSFSKSILSVGDYKNKLEYFPNWAESDFTKVDNCQNIDMPTGFVIMFAGNMGEAQDFDNIMQAALLLKDYSDIKFVFIGDGRKKAWVDKFVLDHHLKETVFVLGRYPIDAMPSFFEKADVMLVSLKDELVFNLTAPAKLQAYMASAKPILAMINGEASDIVKKADCGISVPAGNPQKMKEALLSMYNMSSELLKQKGLNGYSYYKTNFDKDKCMTRLHELIRIK